MADANDLSAQPGRRKRRRTGSTGSRDSLEDALDGIGGNHKRAALQAEDQPSSVPLPDLTGHHQHQVCHVQDTNLLQSSRHAEDGQSQQGHQPSPNRIEQRGSRQIQTYNVKGTVSADATEYSAIVPRVPPPTQVQYGNNYGGAHISGNATVQMGNQEYNCGPASHIHAPSTVSGNMTVNHISYAFPQQHSQNHEEVELKKRLYYEQMDHRKYQLDQVDPASFEWIWTETTFPQWLEGAQGLFWIQGKPASGKSTLINYLITKAEKRVIAHLERGHYSPSILYFFFDFRAGSGVANTFVGLLRSLLIQLMDKLDVVKKYLIRECGYQIQGTWPESQNKLAQLLRSAVEKVEGTICAFIDGLDEYTGDLVRLSKDLTGLQDISQFKVCIASRPHPKLSYHLPPHSLTMQDHNSATVRAFAVAAFSSLMSIISRDFQIGLEQPVVAKMIQRIVWSAKGVILWATFAIENIISAILEGESLEIAAALLDQYPTELNEVYKRVLFRLDEKRRKEAGVILFVVLHWAKSFGNGRSLRLSTGLFLMAYNRIMYDVHSNDKRSLLSEENEPQFKLKVQNILGGLVEFPRDDRGDVRLLHKSLEAFLRTQAQLELFQDVIEKVFDPAMIGTKLLALNLVTASEMLVDDTRLAESKTSFFDFVWLPSDFKQYMSASPPSRGVRSAVLR